MPNGTPKRGPGRPRKYPPAPPRRPKRPRYSTGLPYGAATRIAAEYGVSRSHVTYGALDPLDPYYRPVRAEIADAIAAARVQPPTPYVEDTQ